MLLNYKGTSSLSNAKEILLHLFLLIASFVLTSTWLMSLIVHLPFFNPYCLSARDSPIADSSRSWINFSLFWAVSSIHNGLCAQDSSCFISLLHLDKRTIPCRFQRFENIPSAWHAVYVSRNSSGAALIAVFTTMFGSAPIRTPCYFLFCCILEAVPLEWSW